MHRFVLKLGYTQKDAFWKTKISLLATEETKASQRLKDWLSPIYACGLKKSQILALERLEDPKHSRIYRYFDEGRFIE